MTEFDYSALAQPRWRALLRFVQAVFAYTIFLSLALLVTMIGTAIAFSIYGPVGAAIAFPLFGFACWAGLRGEGIDHRFDPDGPYERPD